MHTRSVPVLPPAAPRRLLAGFGPALRMRREQKSLSQMTLSMKCGVSQRHISFIESGRAAPSRQVVLQITQGLDLSARQRDELLLRAGFAPFTAQGLGGAAEAASGAAARAALRGVLDRHEPFPAAVLNGLGYVQMLNPSAQRLLALLVPAPVHNLTLSVLDEQGLRPFILNWQEVARQHLLRVRRELPLYQEHAQYEAFVSELGRLGVGMEESLATEGPALPDAVLVTRLRKGGLEIDLLSMIVQFGAAYDHDLQELRVECFFPANDASRDALGRLVAGPAGQGRAP